MANKYTHLPVTSRQFAYKHKELGKSNRWIAKQLWVSPSTIIREFRRNRHPCPGIWRGMNCFERAAYAEKKSQARDRAGKSGRGKFSNSELRTYVISNLWQGWSPEDISQKSEEEHGIYISAKSIYNFIRRERPDLTVELYYRGVPRRMRVMHRRAALRQGAPRKKPLSERPKVILKRKEPGHYEIDTVHSLRGISASVLTVIERAKRKVWFFRLPDRTAESVNKVLESFFNNLPKKPKSITVDNGPEFTELYRLERLFAGLQVYYCEPYKSWQRGSVELANGKLRRHFPKKTDFSLVTQEQLNFVEQRINNKPMKLLGYNTPQAAFEEYLLAA